MQRENAPKPRTSLGARIVECLSIPPPCLSLPVIGPRFLLRKGHADSWRVESEKSNELFWLFRSAGAGFHGDRLVCVDSWFHVPVNDVL